MTRQVTPTEQGQLQGALGSVRGIAFMIGPVLFSTVFASFIGPYRGWHLSGAPYLLAAALMAIATIVASRITTAQPAEEVAPAAQPAREVE